MAVPAAAAAISFFFFNSSFSSFLSISQEKKLCFIAQGAWIVIIYFSFFSCRREMRNEIEGEKEEKKKRLRKEFWKHRIILCYMPSSSSSFSLIDTVVFMRRVRGAPSWSKKLNHSVIKTRLISQKKNPGTINISQVFIVWISWNAEKRKTEKTIRNWDRRGWLN